MVSQAGRDEEKLVIWDYHVITLYRPEEVSPILPSCHPAILPSCHPVILSRIPDSRIFQ